MESSSIVDLFNSGLNAKQICEQCNTYSEKVIKILNENGIDYRNSRQYRARKKSKYHLDDDVFANIDSPEKAYWLGFIAADGYVNMTTLSLKIVLSSKDVEALENFKIFLKSNHEIKKFWKKSSLGKNLEYVQLNIVSKKIVKDLVSLGIVQGKSLVLQPPNISENLHRYFIHGYFDGDGGVSFHNVKSRKGMLQANLSFTGTREVCNWISDFFKKQDINTYLGKRMKDNKNNFTLSVNGNRQATLALRLFYQNSEFLGYLRRKYERYLVLESMFKTAKFYIFKGGLHWYYNFSFNKKKYWNESFDSEDAAAISCAEFMKKIGYFSGLKKLKYGREHLTI